MDGWPMDGWPLVHWPGDGMLTISWTSSAVMFGSRPSVWPLPSRTTSAMTRPSRAPGYWYTSATPGRGARPQAGLE